MSCPNCKKKRCTCPEAEQGPIGLTGPQGPSGPMGPMPAHQWNGCWLRFQNPDGSWGPWVNLQGVQGPNGVGIPGIQGVQGLPGTQGVQGVQGTQGAQGNAGADGRSISGTLIDANGDLIITYSDGSQSNAGNVRNPSSSTSSTAPNQKAFLFRAKSVSQQKHTGGAAPGTIVAFSDDSSVGYYDYGGSWSGNDFLMSLSDNPTLRFQLDELSITNNAGAAENVTVTIYWIPAATGVPVSIGTQTINIAAAGTEVFSIQSGDNIFRLGDRARVVVTSAGTDIDINSNGEFWDIEI